MSENKIVLAMCRPMGERVDPHNFNCVKNLILPRPGARAPYVEGRTHDIPYVGAHTVDTARRAITSIALNIDTDPEQVARGLAPITHLLWIDDDMVFQPDAFLRLANADKDIIGGLCFARRQPYAPVISRYQPEEMGLGKDAMGWVYDYPYDQIIECCWTGAAFLLIKMDVIRKMAEKYGRDNLWLSTPTEGEDRRFCKLAEDMGYKIHVDTGCKIGHIGVVEIDEDFARLNRRARWQVWVDPKVIAEKTGKPVASIVIPTYNQQPKYLKAAVWSAIAQSLPTEIIVVDDGSDKPIVTHDDPRSKDKEHFVSLPKGVKVVRHEKNRGIAEALNTGIANMTTDWFAWLSGDDLITPDKIEKQLSFMQHGGYKASCHVYDVLGDDQNPLQSRPVRQLTWHNAAECRVALSRGCCINGSTTMIHKSVFDDVGLFDPEFSWSQDFECWVRIAQKYEWGVMPDALGTKRMDDNYTARMMKDPAAMEKWMALDARIHAKYPVHVCEHCNSIVG